MADQVSVLALRINSTQALNGLNRLNLALKDAETTAAGLVGGLNGFSKATNGLRTCANAARRTTDATMTLGTALYRLGVAFGGAFSFRAIEKFSVGLLSAASDMEEAQGKFSWVMSYIRDDAKETVDELSKSFLFSKREATKSLSTTVDIFTKSGLSLSDSLSYTKDLTERAADLAAFTNVEGGTARTTQALTNAMLGFGQMARRLGVMIYEPIVKTRMAANEQKGLSFATEQAAKMFARFQILMERSASAQGHVARESNNLLHIWTEFKARLDDVKVAFGESLMEPAKNTLAYVTEIVNKLNSLPPEKKQIVAKTALGAGAAGTGTLALGLGFQMARPIFGALLSGLRATATRSIPLVSGLFTRVLGTALGPIGIALTGVYALRKAVKYLPNLMQYVPNLWQMIDGVKNFFVSLPRKIGEWIGSAWKELYEALGGYFYGIREATKIFLGQDSDFLRGKELEKKNAEAAKKAEERVKVQNDLEAFTKNAVDSSNNALTSAGLAFFEASVQRSKDLNDELTQMATKERELAATEKKVRESEKLVSIYNEKIAVQAYKNRKLTQGSPLSLGMTSEEYNKALQDGKDAIKKLQDEQSQSAMVLFGDDKVGGLYQTWREQSTALEKLRREYDETTRSALVNASKLATERREFNENALIGRMSSNYENAETQNERETARGRLLEYRDYKIDEATDAQDVATELGAEIAELEKRINSKRAANAIATLQDLAKTDDWNVNFGSQGLLYRSVKDLSDEGYEVGDVTNITDSPLDVANKVIADRAKEESELKRLKERQADEMKIASDLPSRISEKEGLLRDKKQDEEDRADAKRERLASEEERAKERRDANERDARTLRERWFSSRLNSASGLDKSRLLRWNMTENWNGSVNALSRNLSRINLLDAQIKKLDALEKSGDATRAQLKERDKAVEKRDALEQEFYQKRSEALQRRIQDEDALKNSFSQFAERRAAEYGTYWNERNRFVEGQKALAVGSSEGFNVMSRIYERSGASLEKNVQNIVNIAEVIKNQMLAQFENDRTTFVETAF